MFQNGLQIHFQTLRRRCDLVILKLQLYIVIIVRITIYEQLQLQLQPQSLRFQILDFGKIISLLEF